MSTICNIGPRQKEILDVLNNTKSELSTRQVYDAICEKYPDISSKTYLRASVFIALERMARRALVIRWKGEPSPVRGGKAKIYYKIAEAGRRAVAMP